MVSPILLRANEYWGKRSGTDHPKLGRIFKVKKWGNGANNSGVRKQPKAKKAGWKPSA